jgi:hypothetical protein
MKLVYLGAVIVAAAIGSHIARLSVFPVQGSGNVVIVDRWTSTVYACRGGDCIVLYPPNPSALAETKPAPEWQMPSFDDLLPNQPAPAGTPPARR